MLTRNFEEYVGRHSAQARHSWRSKIVHTTSPTTLPSPPQPYYDFEHNYIVCSRTVIISKDNTVKYNNVLLNVFVVDIHIFFYYDGVDVYNGD